MDNSRESIQATLMSNNNLSEERLAQLIRILERKFRRALERELDSHNVPFGHWIFLRILWENEGLSQRELADRSGLTTPTVHTAVTKMEKLGLIRRPVPKGNVSRPLVHVTPRGRKLKDVLEPLAVTMNEKAAAGISKKDLNVTKKTILKMIGTLSDLE